MKYLLFLSKNYSFSILKPLYDIILKRQAGDVFWFSTQQERFNTNPNIWLKNNVAVLDYSPDVIFAPGNVIPYHWPGLKVQIFHGL
ncbi:MAG: CDP-glycerol--glycerophosphate glycerophosphotransferase, partial [Planctomycetia bacterium]|nr:CDP-glycerol--glycerophosphate glycerophosphotransferase [Planctomycetia bacterium]